MNTEKSSDSVRRARKELNAKVRTDWDAVLARALPHPSSIPTFDPISTPNGNASPTSDSVAAGDGWRNSFRKRYSRLSKGGASDSQPTTPPSAASVAAEALEWRERTYASSDSSTDDDDSDRKTSPRRGSRRPSSIKTADQHQPQDQDPDSQANAASLSAQERNKQNRKRRRRKRVEDEMAINPGLRYWEQRRDIWCLAQSFPTPPDPQDQSPDVALSSSSLTSTSTSNSNSNSSSGSLPSSSASSTQPAKSPPDELKVKTQPFTDATSPQEQQQQDEQPLQQLLPVARPLLPATDPTRQIINPAAYPSIYNKLVTQSLSPSIPINLSHIVPAIVQGWKESGEWPPRQSPSATAAQPTTASGTTVVVKTSQQSARAGSGGGGTSMMRKLRIVDDAKGKGRRLLGYALARSETPADNESSSGAAGVPRLSIPSAQANGDSAAQINGAPGPDGDPADQAAEKEGSGTSTGGSPTGSSPRLVRRSVARMGKALREGLVGGASSGASSPGSATSVLAGDVVGAGEPRGMLEI